VSARSEQAQAGTEIENKDSTGGRAPQEVTVEKALSLAQAHHRSGNLIIAERTYRDILRAVPDHFPTVYYLAAVLFQRGNVNEALQYAKLATEVEPENASCWSNYAAILSANERYEEALNSYDQAIGLDPEQFEPYVNKSHTLFLLERYEEAEEMASHATLLKSDAPSALMNLGIALAAQQKLHDAQDVWQQVLELDPKSGQAYSNWCNTLREMGDLNGAKEKGLKAIELSPKDHDAFYNLVCVYRELGELDEALSILKKATDLKPDYVIAHLMTAKILMGLERYAEALVAARYALTFKKNYAEAQVAMSQCHKGLNQLAEARAAAEKAINLEPEKAIYHLVLADVLIASDQDDEAEAALQKALELRPDSADAFMMLAQVRQSLDMLDEAVAAIDAAMRVRHESPSALTEKARILMYASRIDEALEVYDYALGKWPNNPAATLGKVELLLTINRKKEAGELLEASRQFLQHLPNFYIHMGSHKKYTKDDPDFQRLVAFEKEIVSSEYSKANIYFALADAYEEAGDDETAFEYYKKANDTKKTKALVNKDAIPKMFDKKKEIFTDEFIKKYKPYGFESDLPVFILGMPRSGTTLTEQIVSSHPGVYGAGELHDLGNTLRELGPLEIDSAARMGEGYIKKIRARDKAGKAIRITDKMPGNYTNIGLIFCILPNARIIHCRRNPMDNLLSCYKQNFATGHEWTHDLETLALQYAAYQDLMAYWRKILPEGSFLEIDYEETVNNFETQARRLIDYVGLEWNDACLEPHKKKRAVLTASKDQVIHPIYQSSVDSWRRYEKQLRPLADALEKSGMKI